MLIFTEMKIGKEIALLAKKKNLCEPWFIDMIKQEEFEPLCEMFFKGDDWAMKNDFPDLHTLRKFNDRIQPFGLYTDFKGAVQNKEKAAVFGRSDCTFIYDDFFAGILIVRHSSITRVLVNGNAFLLINLLDDAFLQVDALENSQVVVYKYGENCTCKVTGNVQIKEGSWQK